jgi:hypothetical protein
LAPQCASGASCRASCTCASAAACRARSRRPAPPHRRAAPRGAGAHDLPRGARAVRPAGGRGGGLCSVPRASGPPAGGPARGAAALPGRPGGGVGGGRRRALRRRARARGAPRAPHPAHALHTPSGLSHIRPRAAAASCAALQGPGVETRRLSRGLPCAGKRPRCGCRSAGRSAARRGAGERGAGGRPGRRARATLRIGALIALSWEKQ